ncbi:MAG: deoxyguanosinetriphosphate triphosphohydrolase [Dehalococcoidales bacterium]|nr:deoxyguanosinetriphosphate triphosphohydrolase [Dehalococcoidales bacterium]
MSEEAVNRQLKIRQMLEAKEDLFSPYAQKSSLSRGRLRKEVPDSVRTAFQRDRDRIIHSKSFRRLKHKTQVFIAPPGDHYRTRLTHTLEVSQIARTIARALNLNEDLAEAISLGHDLGHTPFGHVGEDVLNELSPYGFKHNEQSLRVVDLLEKDGKGLNLTWEVRDGIVNHSKSHAQVLDKAWGKVGTLEGEIVKLADIVAYINHDTDDAIRAGIIKESGLPEFAVKILGSSPSARINTMVLDIIGHSWRVSGAVTGKKGGEIAISMSPRVLEATNILRDFLFDKVYNVQSALAEAEKARQIIRYLYSYFLKRRKKLPAEYLLHSDDKWRGVIDYIAGMTDQYALQIAEELSLLNSKSKP